MPRVIETRSTPFLKLHRLLKSYGLNGNNLAPVLGCSPNTAKKKLDNPLLLTVRDIEMIHKYVPIPWEEIIQNFVR